MISVFVQLVWFQQVLEIGSYGQHSNVVCVASVKYWLSLTMISILMQWSEVLTFNRRGTVNRRKWANTLGARLHRTWFHWQFPLRGSVRDRRLPTFLSDVQ